MRTEKKYGRTCSHVPHEAPKTTTSRTTVQFLHVPVTKLMFWTSWILPDRIKSRFKARVKSPTMGVIIEIRWKWFAFHTSLALKTQTVRWSSQLCLSIPSRWTYTLHWITSLVRWCPVCGLSESMTFFSLPLGSPVFPDLQSCFFLLPLPSF